MRYLIKLIIITILISFTGIKQSLASHYMGGEITWECIPAGQPDSGKYIFSMRIYRECGGVPFLATQTIHSNSSAGNIPLTLVAGWPKDISPDCNIGSFGGTSISEITCAGAEATGADNTGAVSEYLYHSAPILITGIPPATGWVFYWASCCRNPATNINGSPGWKLRAKMYSFNNVNMYPCFDNSPVFAETAKSVLPTGFPTEYSNYAFDKELDSLVFEWGLPLTEIANTPVTYSAGYSYNNPLPDSSKNINNVAAVIDTKTGLVSFTSYTTGAFVTSIKVSSYKSGQLVSEIWRDIQVVLLAAGANTPPSLTLNGGIIFQDTIDAGDTVSFTINGSDIGFLPNGAPQNVELEAYGLQFGEYIPASGSTIATFSQTTGCNTPPCASLTPAPDTIAPLTGSLGVQTSFYWETSLNHLLFDSTQGYSQTTYDFVFNIKDDYCPVPASKTSLLSITILPPQLLEAPQIESIVKDLNSDIILKWSPITNDVDSLFRAYYIYMANGGSSNFSLVDSITNPNIGTYAVSNYPDPYMSFYMGIKLRNPFNNVILNSNIVNSMVLSCTNTDNCIFDLQWNSFSELDTTEYYQIFKKSSGNTWALYDSTYNTNYIDTSLWDLTYYKVLSNSHQLFDSLGNVSNTESETNIFSITSPINIGSDTTICEDESYMIAADFGFDTYEWHDGFSLNYYVVDGNNMGVGTYDIWLKANTNYGCEKIDTLVLEVENCTAIEGSKNEIVFEVLPNPSDGKFILEIKTSLAQKAKLDIVSVNGETVYSSNVELGVKKSIIRIDISSVAQGVYYIRLKGDKLNINKTITLVK